MEQRPMPAGEAGAPLQERTRMSRGDASAPVRAQRDALAAALRGEAPERALRPLLEAMRRDGASTMVALCWRDESQAVRWLGDPLPEGLRQALSLRIGHEDPPASLSLLAREHGFAWLAVSPLTSAEGAVRGSVLLARTEGAGFDEDER